MRNPSPSERPDLYDDYDGYSYQPLSVNDLMSLPDHVKLAIEAKQGRPFKEVAQDMALQSWPRASMYHRHTNGGLYRTLPGRPVEAFDQSTGRFEPCELPLAVVRRTVPMTFEEIRAFMRVDPQPDPNDPNCVGRGRKRR